jgi:hypothetical protein
VQRGFGDGAGRYGGERSGRKDGFGARKEIALLEAATLYHVMIYRSHGKKHAILLQAGMSNADFDLCLATVAQAAAAVNFAHRPMAMTGQH